VLSRLLAVVMIALGVAIFIRTIALGIGGGLGFLFGALLVVAGALRLYLSSLR
jgi:hypothetical protein